MAKKEYDVIIVGAGPAGLKAAETLADGGKKVLVLEQKKVIGDKVCAGGLTLRDFELGIPKSIVDKKFSKVIFHTPLQKTVVKQKDFFVATVDRKKLGKWMAKQASKSGAEIRTNSRVGNIEKNHVVVGKEKIRFKYLIGADGSNSIVRKSLGLNDKNVLLAIQYRTKKKFKNLEVFFDYKKWGPFYAWIFPHKTYSEVGTATDSMFMKTNNLKKSLDSWCKGKFDTSKAEFRAHTIRYGYKGFKFGNKFLVGDAGGFASSFTGEGICFAILSGIDAARKVMDKRYKCKNIEHVLKIKKFEDALTRHWEKHKTLSEIEMELMTLLAKSKWVDKEILKHVD